MIRIVKVPQLLVGLVWGSVCPLLLRGAAENPRLTVEQMAVGLAEGDFDLWLVFRDEQLSAAFMTQIYDGALDVFTLAGRGAFSWGKTLSRRLVAFAREQGCERIKFAGRKSHQRVSDYDGALRIAGEIAPGILQYEVRL
jgi:hypothetical protein